MINRKIIVIGCPGSGKSTFSRKLAEITKIPLYHLDAIYWKEDCTHISRAKLISKQRKILKTEQFIIDGNFKSTLKMRIKKADLVFLFDLPTDICIYGATHRKGKRPEMPCELPANDELINFIKDFNTDVKPKMIHLLKQHNSNLITFHSHNEADTYLDNIRKNMTQNIFDNEVFFNSYKALRETDNNYNILLEQPAMKELLPDLNGKTVLDIGCGFGINCMDFINGGAESVTGIDISQKMLAVAREQNSSKGIEYINMDMNDIPSLGKKYDFIYSSLAFHYEEDFERLAKDMYNLLNQSGILLFSQEHPLNTAIQGAHQNKMIKLFHNNMREYILQDYNIRGMRKENWFVDGIEKYHRTFADIINALCKAGFKIESICEPLPSDEALRKRPGLKKEFIRPTFLIVKAIKI